MTVLNAVIGRIFSLHVRLCSTYVTQMRYLFELKDDDEACRQALNQGTFYLFHSLYPFLQKAGHKYSAPQIKASELEIVLARLGYDEQKKEENSVLIGCSDACAAQFALDLGSLEIATVETELKGTFMELRKAFFQLNGRDAPLLSRGQALLRWHETHLFCSKSGQPTHKNVAGSKRVCEANGMEYYPQMCPVAITLVSSGQHCLLARQEAFPSGMFSALAGFCDIGETLEETVRREVAEEVGLEVESLRYSGSQHWPFPNSSLMFACHATVPPHSELNINKQELEEARWFNVEEVEDALRIKGIPPKQDDGTTPFWVPPKWAIAHQLIQEWVHEQRS